MLLWLFAKVHLFVLLELADHALQLLPVLDSLFRQDLPGYTGFPGPSKAIWMRGCQAIRCDGHSAQGFGIMES